MLLLPEREQPAVSSDCASPKLHGLRWGHEQRTQTLAMPLWGDVSLQGAERDRPLHSAQHWDTVVTSPLWVGREQALFPLPRVTPAVQCDPEENSS